MTMAKSKYLDDIQANLYKKFPTDHPLSDPKVMENVFKWNTFFRRNLNRFATDYLGIPLHEYQELMLYEMGNSKFTTVIASRSAAKSFVIALYACCMCCLYPYFQVVVASSTIKQARLIVSEKIKNQLVNWSPMLAREIAEIKDNQNNIIVKFKNNSTITVVAALDSSRGYRSNCLIREEFRQIKKEIDDSVLSPFQVSRPVPYMTGTIYADMKELEESAVDIYISSSWFSPHWMWSIVDQTYDDMLNNKSACLLAFDESVPLKHKIKSFDQLKKEKKKQDPLTWRVEFLNEKVCENTSAFFTHSMFSQNQVNKQPWYPRRDIDVLSGKKNPYDIPKQPGELRIMGVDMSFVTNESNDNSIFAMGRLLPEKSVNGVLYYRLQVVYLESMQGGEGQSQALRIRQLYEDFKCDYIALDTRNGGVLILDLLGKVLYDDVRKIEYSPLSCMNNEGLANRNTSSGAKPCIYAINATQQLNSDIAVNFSRMLNEHQIELLVPFQIAQDEILSTNAEYNGTPDADVQLFYERPFLETQALIAESCALVYEKKASTGAIVVKEQGKNRKDRYSATSYMAWLCRQLEQDLLNISEDYEFCVFIN